MKATAVAAKQPTNVFVCNE